MQAFSILLVEDDDDARRNMEDILSIDGYSLESVSHCQHAIEAVQKQHFDAVIIDWSLPDGSGGDLIPLILRELPNTPVVVVTGIRDFDAVVVALKSGAYDFLLKPINAGVLRSVLGRLVERKQHLLEIEEAQQKLLSNERLAAIGQMVAGLAHESRNALQRSHACLSELSLDLQQMPQSLDLVQKVQKALDDINRLLEEVRNYSAPIILDRSQCSVRFLIEEVWQKILDARFSLKNPEFKLDCEDGFPDACYLDGGRLQQVLRNLLENACFACQLTGPIEVAVSQIGESQIAESAIQITVSDNGEGVPPDKREAIFNPFYTTKTKGTGLGLAISRRIVEAHLGQLYCVESANGGAQFVIELPAQGQIPGDSNH